MKPLIASRLRPQTVTAMRSAFSLEKYSASMWVGYGSTDTKNSSTMLRRSRMESARSRYSVMTEWPSQAWPIVAKLTR
jgi:hypothetical protein